MADIPLPPRSLAAIMTSIADQKDEFRAGDHLTLSHGPWDSATEDERMLFVNTMKIQHITFELSSGISGLIVRRVGVP